MIKRPIFIAAIALAAFFATLCGFFPHLFSPSCDFEDKEPIVLTGTVIRMERQPESVTYYLNHVSAASISGTGPPSSMVKLGKAVLLINHSDLSETDVRIGNRISAECTYRTFRTARNFGNYDEAVYYRSLGISLKAECRDLRILDPSVNYPRQFLNDLRERMNRIIREAVADEETAGLLSAICTGDRSGLTDDTRILYPRSGIAHVLAVSGLHISLIGMTVFWLLRKKMKFLPSAVLCGSIMVSFCILSGESASAVRATIMFLVQIIAIGLGKTYDMICSASLAAVLMLIPHPYLIMSSAFQMSFSAVLASGLIYRPLEKFLIPDSCTERNQQGKTVLLWRQINGRAGKGLLMSMSITMMLLPVIAETYSEIPVYAVFLNLLVIPLMSVVLGSGLISGLAGLAYLLVGRFFIGIGYFLLRFIGWAATLSTLLPASSLITGHPAKWRIVLYYFFLFAGLGVVRCLTGKSKHPATYVFVRRIAAILLFGSLLLMVLAAGHGKNHLQIAMLDVGQGECILLESPSGHTFLIDGGSSSQTDVYQYRIAGAVKYEGIQDIDYVLITHPDTDHISGIMEMLQGMPAVNPVDTEPLTSGICVRHILIPYVPDNDHYTELLSLAESRGVTVMDLHRGLRLQDGDLYFTCLHPLDGYRSEDANSYSAVLDVRYGEFSALFTGDLGAEGEEYLLHAGLEGNYDLLKVAHHGSRFSTTETFLDRVAPKVALISAGVNNFYGHPHEETLERLLESGTHVYSTTDFGEILLEADLQGYIQIRTKL